MFDRQLQGGEICAADVESGSAAPVRSVPDRSFMIGSSALDIECPVSGVQRSIAGAVSD